MDINQIEKTLTKFFKDVSKTIQIDELIIFGSYATGTATRNSDVDVIVVSNDFKTLATRQRLNILDNASRFQRPEIVAAGFTKDEMEDFGVLTMLGQARDKGLRFTPH